jgi:DNA-binding transcriptional ArsR family regulator
MDTQPATILRLDPRGLKVLAHPLRSRLLTALREHGPATATALADRLGTNTGATSYHLRKLASVGLVVETGDGRGRERWWKAATEMHGWQQSDAAGDPDAEAASDWLRRHYLAHFVERYGRWLDAHSSWPLAWQDVAGSSDYALRLSPTGLAAFEADVKALFLRYRDQPPNTDDAADSHVVQVYLYAFPLLGEDR